MEHDFDPRRADGGGEETMGPCQTESSTGLTIGTELTVGREDSKVSSRRLVVAAAKIMAVLQRRWTRTRQWGLRAIKSATCDGNEQNSGHRHLIEESW